MSKDALQKYKHDKAQGVIDKAADGAALIGVGFVAGTFGIQIGGAALIGYAVWKVVKWGRSKGD